ncbi:hypothetical protein DXU06_07085 [Bradyrhizobium elkanii]
MLDRNIGRDPASAETVDQVGKLSRSVIYAEREIAGDRLREASDFCGGERQTSDFLGWRDQCANSIDRSERGGLIVVKSGLVLVSQLRGQFGTNDRVMFGAFLGECLFIAADDRRKRLRGRLRLRKEGMRGLDLGGWLTLENEPLSRLRGGGGSTASVVQFAAKGAETIFDVRDFFDQ